MKKIKQGGFRRRLAVGAAGARGGLGLLSSKAASLFVAPENRAAFQAQALQREAERFVQQLGELKGAYVKIGQMLALYGEHLLPRPVTDALHTLEANTTPLIWDAVSTQLDASLDGLQIEPQPIAAASLSQVHRATAPRVRRPLCVKIQYPGIADTIDDDFRNVMQMLSLAQWVKSGRQLQDLTKELRTHLMSEVDYARELRVAGKFARLLKGDERYRVPAYYPKWSSGQVLTMEYLHGVEVTDPTVQALSQARRNRLAKHMLALFFHEVFDWGLMQTDPNFGNYKIIIDPDSEEDQIALLDFGAVQKLEPRFCKALRTTITSAHRQDRQGTIDGLVELRCLRADDSPAVKQSFVSFCEFILEPFSESAASWPEHAVDDDGNYLWRESKLLKRAGKRGSDGMLVKGFVVPPPEFMLIVRKLTGVFTFVSTLDARMNCAELLQPYLD